MSMEQTKIILDQLAAFHAAGRHYVENYPGGGRSEFEQVYQVISCIMFG